MNSRLLKILKTVSISFAALVVCSGLTFAAEKQGDNAQTSPSPLNQAAVALARKVSAHLTSMREISVVCGEFTGVSELLCSVVRTKMLEELRSQGIADAQQSGMELTCRMSTEQEGSVRLLLMEAELRDRLQRVVHRYRETVVLQPSELAAAAGTASNSDAVTNSAPPAAEPRASHAEPSASAGKASPAASTPAPHVEQHAPAAAVDQQQSSARTGSVAPVIPAETPVTPAAKPVAPAAPPAAGEEQPTAKPASSPAVPDQQPNQPEDQSNRPQPAPQRPAGSPSTASPVEPARPQPAVRSHAAGGNAPAKKRTCHGFYPPLPPDCPRHLQEALQRDPYCHDYGPPVPVYGLPWGLEPPVFFPHPYYGPAGYHGW